MLRSVDSIDGHESGWIGEKLATSAWTAYFERPCETKSGRDRRINKSPIDLDKVKHSRPVWDNVNPSPNPPDDFTTQYTMSVPGTLAGNIQVDIGDFTVWSDNFGATSAVGGGAPGDGVVPEPSCLWLIVIGALGFVPMLVRRLRRQGGGT